MTAATGGVIEPLSERELQILEELKAGASDREIASNLHLSINTVKWHNRQIYSKLQVRGREEAAARAHEMGLLGTEAEQPRIKALVTKSGMSTLALSAFVGRTAETEELGQLLRSNRLVTVTGSAGVGKTRLALRVASAEVERFEDGAVVVSLAPLKDPDRLAEAIAEAVEVNKGHEEPAADSLLRFLRGRQLLLVLDNFEHITGAAPFVADVLAKCPRLHILITSRERLSLYGEQVYPLDPLGQEDAVQLFYLRARSLEPKFDPNEEQRLTIERLCQQLDGLPLAVELAAARIPLLPPAVILERLKNRLDALKGGALDRPERHQTLRMALDWGYELLDADEKHLFGCLAVFANGGSLEAVQAVCGSGLSTDYLDVLESLGSKSLIWQQASNSGEPRIFMLETVRAYAEEQLETSGRGDSVRRRHTEHFVELAERAEPSLRQSHQDSLSWRHRLNAEWENLEAAFQWSMRNEHSELALRMIVALQDHVMFTYPLKAQQWAERALALGGQLPAGLHARAVKTAGVMNFWTGDVERSLELGRQAIRELQELDDREGLAWAYCYTGSALTALGEYGRAQEVLQESLGLFGELEAEYGLAFVHNSLGELMRIQGQHKQAWEAYSKSLQICLDEGIEPGPRWLNLAATARLVDKDQLAIEYVREALKESQERRMTTMLSMSLAAVAGLARASDAVDAVRLMGATAKMGEEIGFEFEPVDQPQYEADLTDLRSRLEEEAFESAWLDGRAMRVEEAVGLASRLAAELADGEREATE